MPDNKKQHIIPALLLRRFSIDNLLIKYNIKNKKIKTKFANPKKENRKNYYYRFGKKDAANIDYIDNKLKDVENRVSEVINTLNSINFVKISTHLTFNQLKILYMFLSHLKTRTTGSFEDYYPRRSIEILGLSGIPNPKKYFESIQDVLDIRDLNIKLSDNVYTKILGKNRYFDLHAETFEKHLSSMNLLVLKNLSETEFFLFDEPIVSNFQNDFSKFFPMLSNKIKTKKFILVCLDPNLCLIFHDDSRLPDFTTMILSSSTERLILHINIITSILSNSTYFWTNKNNKCLDDYLQYNNNI